MILTTLVLLATTPLAIVFLSPLGRLRKATGTKTDAEHAAWRPVTAEVVSVLRASNRTFLLVRYHVGTQQIHNDVQYPLAGAVPAPGERVPIRYDPSAPARMEFDTQHAARTPVAAGR